MVTFQRRRVRGGIVRIEIDGRFAGEIATCKWGYALRLPGIFWSSATREPARGGLTEKGFKRQRDAIHYVEDMDRRILSEAAEFAALHNVVMA